MKDQHQIIFQNRNHFGYYMAICAPLSMGLFLQRKERTPLLKIGRILEVWLILDGMMATNTRGSLMAVFAALVGWNAYILFERKDLKKRVLWLDVLFIGTVLFLHTGDGVLYKWYEFFANMFHHYRGDLEKMTERGVSDGRAELWKYGMQFAFEKPLFGWGPANLAEPYSRTDCIFFSPHNDLVLISASLGLPALVFYVSGLAGHVRGFFRFVKKMSVFEVTLYAAVGSYLISSFFGVSMYYTTPYYFLLLGFSYGVYRKYAQSGVKDEK